MNGEDDAAAPEPADPRERDPHASQQEDPLSGVSDDPRVDPTPDRRQSDKSGTA